jgi:hypothetical protein
MEQDFLKGEDHQDSQLASFQAVDSGKRIASGHERLSSSRTMTLRIDRVRERVRLSGEFRSEHVHQVKAEMDQCGPRSVLDLEEVDLVDVEAIHFLNSCAAQGVAVLNASAYIRAWMVQERERPAH